MKLLSTADLTRTWEDLCANPKFKDLGYKVELHRNGNILMSPANIRHGRIQSAVVRILLELKPEGEAPTECAIQTEKGILVPDVSWCSAAWLAREADATAASTAPELCVEIMSASNTLAEMEGNRDAYFLAGCEEFILIDLKGFVTFFAPDGPLEASALASGFPARVTLPF